MMNSDDERWQQQIVPVDKLITLSHSLSLVVFGGQLAIDVNVNFLFFLFIILIHLHPSFSLPQQNII